MTYVVIVISETGEETKSSFRKFPSQDAAEAWARRMVRCARWRVEAEGCPAAKGLDL